MLTTIINNITMNIFKYDSNNTEGKYPTAMVVEGAELKKGDKIVATDLVDLYDTDINNPIDRQVLTYIGDKWVVGESEGIIKSNILQTPYIVSKNDNDTSNLASGYYNSFIIAEDGTLWGTGRNNDGQLGLGDYIKQTFYYIQIETDTDWKQVDCGGYHSLAIKENGTLWGTGRNSDGQLGLGDNNSRNVFIKVGTDTDWKQSAGGDFHSLAVKEDGTLWSTGDGDNGRLGLGDYNDRNVFTRVGTDTNWKQSAGGIENSSAVKEDGTLWSTGSNSDGQLGLGDYSYKNVFTQESEEYTDWEQVACGNRYSLAVKEDGTLWGTGYNSDGQLSMGSNTNNTIFVQSTNPITNITIDGQIIILVNQYDTPISSLKEIFTWLRNDCIIIPEDGYLRISLSSNEIIKGELSLNHPNGYNIKIDGHGNVIDTSDGLLTLSDNNTIEMTDITMNNLCVRVTNNSCLKLKKISSGGSVNNIEIISSVMISEETPPKNVLIDMNSTVKLPDLNHNIDNWKAKNNSFVIINTETTPAIDIYNENSTIILNDAEI